MIKELVEQWEIKKDEIREYFKNSPQKDYNTYEGIARVVFSSMYYNGDLLDVSDMQSIWIGRYHGDIIIFMHQEDECIITTVSYGSCCVCDTIEAIKDAEDGNPEDETPSPQQLEDYMTLALHMVQRARMFPRELFGL